jgi:FMN phosphatase YigB (HAD superfamily)
MNNLKIVFIDWNNTLSKSKFWEHLKLSSTKDLKLFKKLEKSLFINNSHLLKPWMRGDLVTDDVVKIISKNTKIDIDYVFNHFIKSCKEMVFISKEIPELIKKIQHKSIKVYIATDNMDSFNKWTIPEMKLADLFDGIINSFDRKALKTDFDENGKNSFFKDVLKTEKINPKNAVLIDDSEDKNGNLSSFGIIYKRIDKNFTLKDILIEIIEDRI